MTDADRERAMRLSAIRERWSGAPWTHGWDDIAWLLAEMEAAVERAEAEHQRADAAEARCADLEAALEAEREKAEEE